MVSPPSDQHVQQRWLNRPIATVGWALLYLVAARFGLVFVIEGEGIATFWPASGVALAALLLTPQRRWVALMLGLGGANTLANLLGGNTLSVSIAFALVNSAEGLLAAWLVHHVLRRVPSMDRLRDLLIFIFLAVVGSNALTALLGAVLSLFWFGLPFWLSWRMWWVVDGLGMVVVAPALLSWLTLPSQASTMSTTSRWRWLEATSLAVGLIVTAATIFGSSPQGTFLLPYPIFPFLLWAALRFGGRGAASSVFATAVIAVWATVQGRGPFAIAQANITLAVIDAHLYVALTAVSTFILAAVMGERQMALAQEQRAHEQLASELAQRIKAEAVLQNSLHEKEVLLREIHHRVKNNLQVIISILRLQSGAISDQTAIEHLRDSQNRVRSMALVHEHLYRAPDLAHVSARLYLGDLLVEVMRTYGPLARTIHLHLEIDDLLLNPDTAIPLGLIAVELVSNSLKHAFPVGQSGKIIVALHTDDRNRCLHVSDNGRGLPPAFDIAQPATLGFQLVETLTHQLGGTLTLSEGSGAHFSVCW